MALLRLMSFIRLMSSIRLMSIFLRRKKKRESKSGALHDGYVTESDCEDSSSAKKLKINKHGQQETKDQQTLPSTLKPWILNIVSFQ